MGFVSNIFKRADKDIKYTHSGTTGNSDTTDVRGYSKAVIQFSGERNVKIRGYLDKITDSQVLIPMATTLEHRPIINLDNITEKTVIVDVSDLSVFFIEFNESYTGDVFVHLTQDEVKIDRNGITVLATKTVNVVDGTNNYESGFVDGFENFRFWAIEIRRRDGNGYLAFTADFIEYHKIPKIAGAGPEYSGGKTILSVKDAHNGYAQSEWLENYSNGNSVDISINGTDYDGAVLEITFLGIA